MRVTDTAPIKDAIDITQFVGQYVKLRNGYGLCPFHKEKSPSFHVVTDRKAYKCFGCGASGDVIKFYQEIEGVSFPAAVKYLADYAGVSITEERAKRPTEAKTIAVEVSEWAENWRGILVAARNHCYDTGVPAERLEELHLNHVSSTPKEMIAAYMAVRTPWLAQQLRDQYAQRKQGEKMLKDMIS